MQHTSKLLLFVLIFLFHTPAQQKELTFESIFTNRDFYGGSISFKWMPDGNISVLLYSPEESVYKIFKHDIISGNETVLVSAADLNKSDDDQFRIQNYEWFPDGNKILFSGRLTARTFKSGGKFYVYDLTKKEFILTVDSPEQQVNAGISPDGKKLGIVRGNNIFSVDIETGKETQLTFDGNENILNGVFDWVYEEEFSIIKGWEWSPDNKHIAFWRLDQSNVPEVTIAKWDSLYMEPLIMKYPKPGAPNSLVKIGVVNIESGGTIWMDTGEEEDIYIPRIKFTKDPSLLAIQRLNRLQNKIELLLADVKSGSSKVIITELSDGWVEVVDELKFLDNGTHFIWSSEKDGFKHLYLFDMNGKQEAQITKGNWEVKSLTGVDEKKKKIYFRGNERGILYQDFYSVDQDGKNLKRITPEPGCNTPSLSPSNNYFINRYSSSNMLTATSVYSIDGSKIRDLVSPSMDFLEEYGFAPVEFFKITTTDGIELDASIIKPVDFDPDKKYPVLFHVYGGPGSEDVLDRWEGFDFLFHQLLVKQGYIIFKLDNRITGNKGTAMRYLGYKNLGKWEVNDMIEGAKYLVNEGIADPERIGIWGWSYGGYLAAITMLNAADYFKAGVAIGSVTDWRFYDNIYTERFMQTPELNPEGYKESSTLTHAKKLKGNLLLVHGTADDNVHFQNTVRLAEALIDENKQFEVMFYPEKTHGIYGGASRQQLFKKIYNFLLEKL